MKRFSKLAAVQWIFRFCSPFAQQTPLPPPHAWARIFHVADRGLVLPRLAIALAPHRRNISDEVAQFLEASLELARYRNDRLRDQLFRICSELNALNIKPILIKGASFLVEDHWRDSRIMLDLDLWVPDPDQQQIAIHGLQKLGYQMREKLPPDFYHFAPFYHDDEIARVELHSGLNHPYYASKIDQSSAIASCTDHSRHGIAYSLLSSQTALALSYVQCCESELTMGGQRQVVMMKWFDLLDRIKSLGFCDVAGPETLGITGAVNSGDFQFLTALNQLANLPYSGKRDDTFVRIWEKNYRRSDFAYMLGLFFKPIFELQRWKGKSPAAIGRALINKAKSLPVIRRRARERF